MCPVDEEDVAEVVKASVLLPKGAVVHLGERLICIQEVGGSNPPGSSFSLQVVE